MKKLGFVVIAAVLAVTLAPSADACAAAYVKAIGNNDGSTWSQAQTIHGATQGVAQEASDVARGFIDYKGCDPDSPAGQVIHPYMEGVARYEHYNYSSSSSSNRFNLSDGYSTNISKACDTGHRAGRHFEQHYNDAQSEVDDLPTQIQSSISGG